jgi:SAM-dependent methyltransferase
VRLTEHADEGLEGLYERYGGLGQLKIDLGSGFYKPPGFIGLDNLSGAAAQVPELGSPPDVEIDLHSEPLPFPDGSVAVVRTSHYLEHSPLDETFDEVHRVLVPGGVFDNTMPYALSDDGLFPGHAIFLTEKWFTENLHFQRLFRIVSVEYFPSPDYATWPWLLRRVVPFGWARRHLFNVCSLFRLVAEKRD